MPESVNNISKFLPFKSAFDALDFSEISSYSLVVKSNGEIEWSEAGGVGPIGPTGPTGPEGPIGATGNDGLNTPPSTVGVFNRTNIDATANVDRFIRFRSGGGTITGVAGTMYSDFDSHNWFQYSRGNGFLNFSYMNTVPTTNDVGSQDTKILRLTPGGQVLLQDGTVTNPSLSFQSNTNTGIFRPDANQLSIATNGVERVTVGTASTIFTTDILVNGVTVGRGRSVNFQQSNTVVGRDAFVSNTTGANNTAVGYEALRNNTIGNQNIAVGRAALLFNTTGEFNIAIGNNSLLFNTTGANNTAIGYDALRNNTIGNQNTAVGPDALRANSTGNQNTAVGRNVLGGNSTGNQNTAVGWDALGGNNGDLNVGLGYQAGRRPAVGPVLQNTSNSVFIGADTKALDSGQTNQIVIGHEAVGAGSNSVVLGNDNITKTVLKGEVLADGERVTTSDAASPNEVLNFWSGTQAQYDGLSTYSTTTIYFIED